LALVSWNHFELLLNIPSFLGAYCSISIPSLCFELYVLCKSAVFTSPYL
jgi:hypothetical protein